MLIDIPIQQGYDTDQLFIVAPALHPEKGIGYVLCPITREMLADVAPVILQILDDTVRRYTEPHVPDTCAQDEGKGCICLCLDCTTHNRPTPKEIMDLFRKVPIDGRIAGPATGSDEANS